MSLASATSKSCPQLPRFPKHKSLQHSLIAENSEVWRRTRKLIGKTAQTPHALPFVRPFNYKKRANERTGHPVTLAPSGGYPMKS